MNARTLRLALSALVALALATSAWAQEQDAFLQRYGLAVEHLQAAVEAMPGDAVTARDSVDRAFASLLTLARDAAGSNLVVGMQRVFERARTAISNGSRDDLAVQTSVLEGAFQRLVYDAALRSALAGDLATARARLARVAEDVGFADTDAAALVDPTQPTATLRFLVETGVAQVVATRLAVARELAPSDPAGAYRALAEAYGHFLLVQDSPRALASLNQSFVDAAGALVSGDPDGAIATLAAVEGEVAAMGLAARERRASVPGGGSAVAVQPVVLPSAEEDAVADAVGGEGAAVADAAAASEPLALVDVTAFLMELEETNRRVRLDALEAELDAAGVPAPQRPAHAARLLDAGFESLHAAVASLAAGGARAVAAAHLGDDQRARSEIAAVGDGYGRLLSPIVRTRDTQFDTTTTSLIAHLGTTSPLRVQDAVVLAGQIDAVGALLAEAGGTAALQRGAAATTSMWAGPVRDVVALIVGLLALVPLFLLNLAFGGGNRHWQAIGVALFLLWLPALFEGVIGLGGVLARFAGFDALVPLAAYSVLGNTVAQTVWAALTLLAVLFAIAGLSGISRQFGLLGGRRKGVAAATGATPTRTVTDVTAKTVDWDDEG
jgi:hypothetical protein